MVSKKMQGERYILDINIEEVDILIKYFKNYREVRGYYELLALIRL